MPEKRYKRREFLKGLGFLGAGVFAGSLASRIAEAYSIPQVEKIYSPKHPDYTADVIVYRDGEHVVAVDNKGNTIARSTDHAEVIQKAIDSLSEGGRVFVKAGTYNCRTTITINKPISFLGEHKATVLQGDADPILLVTREGATYFEGFEIGNLVVVQNNDNRNAVVFRLVSWGLVYNLRTSGGLSGVRLEGAIGNIFINLYVWGAKAAFQEPPVGAGLFITSYSGVLANFNKFIGGRIAGCKLGILGQYGQKNLFLGMDIESNERGMVIYSGFGWNTVRNCWLEGNTVNAILITRTGTEQTVIEDSIISVPSGASGITIYGDQRIIAKNTFYGDGSPYISILAGAVNDPKSIKIMFNRGLSAAKINDEVGAFYIGNMGYVTENSGVATLNGDATTTDFLIGSHGLSPSITDPSKVVVKCTPASADAIAASPLVCYLSDEDADGVYESIRVKFASAPPSGTNNVKVVWEVEYIG